MFGLVIAASCGGSVGEPRVDAFRSAACKMATFSGAVALAMQQWEKRIIEELNAARDGGTQEVVMMPPDIFFSVEALDSGGDPYFDNLADHAYVIGLIGEWIFNSIQTTFDCDAWAQYDVRGIECGDNQRDWTDQLFKWLGERYSAVSAIEGALNDQLGSFGSDDELNGFISDFDYDRIVIGWEGWELQQ